MSPESAHQFYQALLQLFAEQGQTIELSRHTPLLRTGEVEHYLHLIEEGVVRAYLLAGNEEHTIRFGYAGNIINSLASYLHRSPSALTLEALRKTRLRRLHRRQLETLMQAELPGYTAFLEAQLAAQLEREIDLLTLQPQERLQRVMDRSPQLFQEVPLRFIASYLRMSPETLSRIRGGL